MTATPERRETTRIDKVFRVLLSTDEVGDQWAVARNISPTGMFVDMPSPLPLRTKVLVRFQLATEEASLSAIARVQNHYYFQFSDAHGLRGLCGVGLRFLRFVPDLGAPVPTDRLH
jgi:hypothetical protein